MPGINIFVRRGENNIIIKQTSHFQLSYSNTQQLTVTVSDNMADKLCGACDRFSAVRDTMGFSQDTMQEYMASFSAQDFPTWWVAYRLVLSPRNKFEVRFTHVTGESMSEELLEMFLWVIMMQ